MNGAQALWVTARERAEIRETRVPERGASEVRVRTLYSAVSRGTEALVFRGSVPESEQRRMRCPHQEGDFPWPVKYGYSSVGRVLEGPDALRDRLVFCLYPHQTSYVVPESAVIPLPDGVPPERAVLAANLETCVNACWDAPALVGDRVSIVGAGVIGSLMAFLIGRVAGVELELIDVADRTRIAERFGARFCTPERASRDRDLVIHASATPSGLGTALELAATDATVLELSWFGRDVIGVRLGGAFHVRRLALRASQVGTVSPGARRRFDHRARLALALALCADPRLDSLFADDIDFAQLPRAMAELCGAESAGIGACQRVRYP